MDDCQWSCGGEVDKEGNGNELEKDNFYSVEPVRRCTTLSILTQGSGNLTR